MAEYTLRCFAQSGNAHEAALALGGRDRIVGDRTTIADLSCCGYLYLADELGVDWNGYPSVRDGLARLAALPGWRHPYELMPGHPRPAAAVPVGAR